VIGNVPLIDLQKERTFGAKENTYSKNLINIILKVPEKQGETLLNYIKIQIEWLKRLLNELRGELDSSIIKTAACPIGNLSETVIINSVLNQILTEQVLRNLNARMREEEFEIVVAHLIREIPELKALLHK